MHCTLDCFQPIGPRGLFIRADFENYMYLVTLFWKDNLFHITREEMYTMNSNVFSIDSNVVVSEKTSLD
jgi:hypothetical protein